MVYNAFSVFRRLVGGRIWVRVERRPGRKRTVVRGIFTPRLLSAIGAETPMAGRVTASGEQPPCEAVEVWLRQPPKLDRLAERVHELMDLQGLSYREAATKLQEEGENVNSGNVWYIYRRWYQIQGLPLPERPYNNGRPRRLR
jgi:hypothetical protein